MGALGFAGIALGEGQGLCPLGSAELADAEGLLLVDERGNGLTGAVAVDHPRLGLAQFARTRGLRFGSAIDDAAAALPGPDGAGTLGDFLAAQADLYVPGSAMLPQHVQYQHGVFDTAPLAGFLDRVAAEGKAWRGHVLLYPAKDRPWVDEIVDAGNWQAEMDAHFEAIAAVPGAKTCTNLDVVNEVLSAAAEDGYRPNAWYRAVAGDAPAYIAHAFAKARALWPATPLYFCHDHTEQITDGYHRTHAANILRCLEDCLARGAPIDGFNQQAHLTYRLGFHAGRLRDFLRDLRALGLSIIIGELDARTGYGDGFEDTPAPADYASAEAYDRAGADLIRRYLDIALPFVAESGGQVLCCGLSDIRHAWANPPEPPGERPLPWDAAYRPKPQYHAIRQALLEL